MIKKLTLLFVLIFILETPSFGNDKMKSSDLVDIHKNHWAYGSIIKLIDEYEILQGFPDHTFRGERTINHYEFSIVILNLIKYLEKSNSLSFKITSISAKDDFLNNFPAKHWAFKSIEELYENYSIKLFLPDSQINGENILTRNELAYSINQIIKLIKKNDILQDKNPYTKENTKPNVKKDSELLLNESINNVRDKYKIMVGYEQNDFKGNQEVTRYQLAVTLFKTIEFINNNILNSIP